MFLWLLTLFASSSLCNGSFGWQVLLCCVLLISIDLRMLLVSHGLFKSFFCLFDTFWRGAQKFINFSTFWEVVQRTNRNHCDLNAALLIIQHFPVENLCFFLFFNILDVSEHLLCAIKFKWADFQWSKTEHDGLTMCHQDFQKQNKNYSYWWIYCL